MTRAHWHAVMGGKRPRRKDALLPVVEVTWFDAVRFCNAASDASGRTRCYDVGEGEAPQVTWNRSADGVRLPTEAEWEYACHAGTTTRYWPGHDEADVAKVGWFDANSSDRLHRVAELPPNAWDLHDTHGNVWEWCWVGLKDYDNHNFTIAIDNPIGSLSKPFVDLHVARGGSFWHGAGDLRASNRLWDEPKASHEDIGFRCVRGPRARQV